MLDVITIGRSSVDLYGQQIGGRLEDMGSFAKAVGGCPTNIAIGCARLGLKPGLITRVGDEAMGRFIREQLVREGVDVTGVATDPQRLTALVILGVRSERDFPLIFYRENCADMALTEADIDPAFIRSAGAVLITGTHLSAPGPRAACRKAMRIAREAGAKVVLDIDYRPNLWGLAGHGEGAARYIDSAAVTASLQALLPGCDLVVGTEEEFHIAGGCTDTIAALRTVRGLTAAALVCKRGPMGCAVFPAAVTGSIEGGIQGAGFAVEVYNVLGAGDAFMAGLLRGWLRGESWEVAARWANACGAIAVSRLLCSPEYPSWTELQHFLREGVGTPRLREDETLNHLHRTTTRRREWPELMALAIDHRKQLAALCARSGADPERLARFKALGVAAAIRVANGAEGFGVLCDGLYGRAALFRAESAGLWIGRPVEEPGSIPLRFEPGLDLGAHLLEWPIGHVAKCLCFYHPGDAPALRAEQSRSLLQLQEAARRIGREFLVEIICGHAAPLEPETVGRALDELYACGLKPDWWKLEPHRSPEAWAQIDAVIARRDPYCRGVVILGLEADRAALQAAFRAAGRSRFVKGFAVGRSIFNPAAERWLPGEIDDETAIADMAARFRDLVTLWRERNSGAASPGGLDAGPA
jgi:5-dehydro-2-deoxygluconokinase